MCRSVFAPSYQRFPPNISKCYISILFLSVFSALWCVFDRSPVFIFDSFYSITFLSFLFCMAGNYNISPHPITDIHFISTTLTQPYRHIAMHMQHTNVMKRADWSLNRNGTFVSSSRQFTSVSFADNFFFHPLFEEKKNENSIPLNEIRVLWVRIGSFCS